MTQLLRLALVVTAAALCFARAQDDQQEQQKPPTEIPDFSHLDEYIYVPKSTLNFGYRYTSGAKTGFSGHGYVPSPEQSQLPSGSAEDVNRTYHDGYVDTDTRSVATDNGNGTNTSTGVNSADGKTNSWSYDNQSQLTTDNFMQFHTYSATTNDGGAVYNKTGKGNVGMEVFVAHDMRKLTRHLEFKVFGGFSVNDIQASRDAIVNANVTTQTDTYDLYGVTPPSAPYTSPSSITTSATDANGNTISSTTDNSILISAAPISSTTSNPTPTPSAMLEQFKLHGAYATFRVGPMLMYDFNDHLKLSLSAGPALIYAGSTYQINEVFTPASGDQIIDTVASTTNRLLFGYYVDATLQYDLTDRTGFYLGAFDQSAGSYTQGASSQYGVYNAKVDFTNQDGFRTGLSYKF